MARPIKEGLDYFELDCHMDEKIRLIQAEFGLKGFAVVVLLFMEIYGGKGYYMSWNEDTLLLFALQNCGAAGGDKNLIEEIVAACIRRDIFSKELFEKYQILTSSGIQKRYLNAVARRENVTLKKEYLLVTDNKKTVSANNNSVNVNRNSKNADSNTQSREEKIRVDNKGGGIYIPPAPEMPERKTPIDELTEEQMQMITDAWNKIPHAVKIRGIIPMTPRYNETRLCISIFGYDGILQAIKKAGTAEWLKNKGKIVFDSFINRNAVQKLLEGAYDEDYQAEKDKQKPKKTRFNDFHQREYDYKELERKLMNH